MAHYKFNQEDTSDVRAELKEKIKVIQSKPKEVSKAEFSSRHYLELSRKEWIKVLARTFASQLIVFCVVLQCSILGG